MGQDATGLNQSFQSKSICCAPLVSKLDIELRKCQLVFSNMLKHRELYSGLIRLHILHHACEKPVFGLWIIEELGHHGYKLSPGTVYPLLHGLEKRGYLKSKDEKVERSVRRLYSTTPLGKKALLEAKGKVKELLDELNE